MTGSHLLAPKDTEEDIYSTAAAEAAPLVFFLQECNH